MSYPSDFLTNNPTLGEKSLGEDIRGKGDGNGTPLHCSCLENPRDRGACWAAVSGVAQSRTRLKWLSSSSRSSQSYGFSSGHVWMWKLDYKESWVLKNWCFLTVVLEKTLENPLDCKEIQPVHPKGNQFWIFTGLLLKLKLQYFGHVMQRADSFEKILMLGKTEGRRRRGWQRMKWLDGVLDSVDMSLSKLKEIV